jgi:hypothetical protein
MIRQDEHGQPIIPIATGDAEEDVFLFVGFVSFLAQGLEAELVNLAVVLRANGEEALGDDELDLLFDAHEKKTLGKLFLAIRARLALPEESEAAIVAAVEERNRLTHHFFRQHTEDFLGSVGRREMIEDLRTIGTCLLKADRCASDIGDQLWAMRGVTMAMRELAVKDMKRSAESRDGAV